mmetsp:Transcript_6174/g.16774  ORF Transcript_6174/g.16774 Transcript_6174/m.16774 type:complete len:314 (-) Transcript_6174:1463-2404(-)
MKPSPSSRPPPAWTTAALWRRTRASRGRSGRRSSTRRSRASTPSSERPSATLARLRRSRTCSSATAAAVTRPCRRRSFGATSATARMTCRPRPPPSRPSSTPRWSDSKPTWRARCAWRGRGPRVACSPSRRPSTTRAGAWRRRGPCWQQATFSAGALSVRVWEPCARCSSGSWTGGRRAYLWCAWRTSACQPTSTRLAPAVCSSTPKSQTRPSQWSRRSRWCTRQCSPWTRSWTAAAPWPRCAASFPCPPLARLASSPRLAPSGASALQVLWVEPQPLQRSGEGSVVGTGICSSRGTSGSWATSPRPLCSSAS